MTTEAVEPTHPNVTYVQGFPLATRREDNIRAVAKAMRDRAEMIFNRTDTDGDPLTGFELDIDYVAESLAHYADLVETLNEHGTRGFYDRGCRCDWCVAGFRLSWRINNRKRKKTYGSRTLARQKWAMAMAVEEEQGEEL